MRVQRADRGFTLTELMLTVAVAATILAMAVPVMTDVTESSRLNAAAREIERELQGARLNAVTANRILRVRLNCPVAGEYRTVEYLADATRDDPASRCEERAYPFPAPDDDLLTRPNHDGPLRRTPTGTTISSEIVEFHPDGRSRAVVSNASQEIVTPLTVTVTRHSRTRAITINGAGKIQIQP